ncbi:SusC/RagA family TonB-linked outer membrane protein [Sphingobacterium paucimobilis]|uniref:TonB-dependent receptor plug domain-containing protein n=1 Tax=Sphingobacterium paucimobilis HER1398 TaxID=1346330 RepID=U2HC53_9SPHI|nr:SusC/RagA family TonB-linked outer membrane protein [Sphingobacterium paucimobilis]ERJ59336.1 hypothetical protein M472_11180 [Sphingobacterium paucimobilis HER1398]
MQNKDRLSTMSPSGLPHFASRSKFGTQRNDERTANRNDGKVVRNDEGIVRQMVFIIFCVLFSGFLVSPAFGQGAKSLTQTVVRGVVSSHLDGKPIEGASVTVDKKHTRTYKEGRFTISVDKPTGILTIKHIGYKEQRVAYENTATILNIALRPGEKQIEEVEVISTGYQKIPKERATGSFVQIDSTILALRVTPNILSRLDGTAAGLQFDNRTGRSKINVRGINSLNELSQNPLIVLDNFPYEGRIEDIDPETVESVTILKDAAATSIWGVKAGNGVIVINRKKIGSDESVKISLSNRTILQDQSDLLAIPDMSSADFIEMERMLYDKGFYNSKLNAADQRGLVLSPVVRLLDANKKGKMDLESMESAFSDFARQDYREDLMKYFYRNPLNNQFNVNIAKGGNKYGFGLTAMLQQDRGENKYAAQRKLNVGIQNTFMPIRGLQLRSHVNVVYAKVTDRPHGMGYGYSPGGGLSGIYPYLSLVGADGTVTEVPNGYNLDYVRTAGSGLLMDWIYRPYEEHLYNKTSTHNFYLNSNLDLRYEIDKGIAWTVMHALEMTDSKGQVLNMQDSYTTRDLVNRYTQIVGGTPKYMLPKGDMLTNSFSSAFANRFRTQIDINRKLSKIDHLSAIVGFEISDQPISTQTYRSYGYNSEILTSAKVDYLTSYPIFEGLSFNTPIPFVDAYKRKNSRVMSLYANAGYTVLDKYQLFGSVRRDGSNNFGKESNEKWNPLWSFGLAWNLKKERFLAYMTWLDQAKIRGTIGHSGNIGAGALARPILIYSAAHPYTNLPYATISLPPNPKLKWEDVKMYNLGLDMEFLGQSLSGSIDLFWKHSTDLISNDPIDPTTGLATAQRNVGELKGRGIDVALRYKTNISQIQVSSMFNVSYVKDRVETYNGTLLSAVNYMGSKGESIRPITGQRLYPLYSFRSAGLDPDNGDPRGYFRGEISKNYSKINTDSLQYHTFHGTSLPPYYGNFKLNISYHGFTVSSNVQFKFGHYFRKNSINYGSAYRYQDIHEDFQYRWQKPGDEQHTNVPSMPYPAVTARDDFYNYSDVLVHKGDLIRLNDLSASYRFKGRIGQRIVHTAISVNCSNVGLLWRRNSVGVDPDYNRLPAPRSYGFNVTFNY